MLPKARQGPPRACSPLGPWLTPAAGQAHQVPAILCGLSSQPATGLTGMGRRGSQPCTSRGNPASRSVCSGLPKEHKNLIWVLSGTLGLQAPRCLPICTKDPGKGSYTHVTYNHTCTPMYTHSFTLHMQAQRYTQTHAHGCTLVPADTGVHINIEPKARYVRAHIHIQTHEHICKHILSYSHACSDIHTCAFT